MVDAAAVASAYRALLERMRRPDAGRLIRSRDLSWRALFLVASLLTALPLFVTRYLPIQDLPQHIAAVRVLYDYSNAEFGFQRFFEVDLLRTQYLSVYLAAYLLSFAFGPVLATKLVLASALVGLPYALRSLLRARAKPESYALLSLPLAYNAHFILGFLNFIAGLPLLFWGAAAAVRLRRDFNNRDAVVLGAISLVCLYTHVIPYLLLLATAGILALRMAWRATLLRLVPLAPSVLAFLIWLVTNPAGRIVTSLADEQAQTTPPEFASPAHNLQTLGNWLADILPGSTDEYVFVGLVVLLALIMSVGGKGSPHPHERDSRVIGLLVPATVLAYFMAPVAYDWIWPINARFPLLALLLVIPTLPRLEPCWRPWIAAAAISLHVLGVITVTQTFLRVAEKEYAGLEHLLERAPPGQKLVALIWDRNSRHVRFSTFLHAAAWYQVERGGAVMFSFADFPQSPISFRESNRPPRVPPRWEWRPERVRPQRDLVWFDYVLTRGGNRPLGFERVERAGHWALWKRAEP